MTTETEKLKTVLTYFPNIPETNITTKLPVFCTHCGESTLTYEDDVQCRGSLISLTLLCGTCHKTTQTYINLRSVTIDVNLLKIEALITNS